MKKESILQKDITFYHASLETQQMKLYRCLPSEETRHKDLCLAHQRVIDSLKNLQNILEK